MMVQKVDRRIGKTRQLLREALIALILEKGYEKITVQHILDKANVGRSTFYAHFQDKDDLLLRGVVELAYGEHLEEAIAKNIQALKTAGLTDTISMANFFEHVSENSYLHQIMRKQRYENVVLERGLQFLSANIQQQLEQFVVGDTPPAVPLPLLTAYLAGGLMALAEWWLAQGMPYSPEEIEQIFQKLALPGLKQMVEE